MLMILILELFNGYDVLNVSYFTLVKDTISKVIY